MSTPALIDTHVHFWNNAQVPVSWTANAPAINRSFEPKDYRDAIGDVEVEALVFVEADVDPGAHLDEARWIESLKAEEPRIEGIVAHAPLHKGAAVAADLEALAKMPLVKGIRRLLQGESDPAFCLKDEFIEGVRLLPRHGLHFEICIYHHQLEANIELVRRCPEVSFVLDHIAKPGIKDGLVEPWKTQIREMAGLPNVVCKLSGVATEADHAAWREEQLEPYMTHVLECFGPDRVMFGSDWPVATLAIDYPRWVEICHRVVQAFDPAAVDQVFRRTARRVYRLG